MSYTPTNWKRGDVITAEKLNNMESGILDANQNVYIATLSYDGSNYSCDKTPEQIRSAADGGAVVFLKYESQYQMEQYPICWIDDADGDIIVTFSLISIGNPEQNSFSLLQRNVRISTDGIRKNVYVYNVSATKESV